MLTESSVKVPYVLSLLGVIVFFLEGIRTAVQQDESGAHNLLLQSLSRLLQCVSSRPAPDGVIVEVLSAAQIIVLSALADVC